MANQDDFRRTSQNEPIGVVLDKLLKISYKINIKKPSAENIKLFINNIANKENIVYNITKKNYLN